MVVPIYIPTNSVGEFPFSTPSPAFVLCGLINDDHSGWCEVVSHGNFILSFLRYLHSDLHSGCTRFSFPPTVKEGSLFSTSSPAFVICGLVNDGHSDQCEVVTHHRFNLHFSNNQ